MMDVVLYTTHCPKCKVLEAKLKEKNIDYASVTDVAVMIGKGFQSAPILEVDENRMDFSEAVKWVNNQ